MNRGRERREPPGEGGPRQIFPARQISSAHRTSPVRLQLPRGLEARLARVEQLVDELAFMAGIDPPPEAC